MRNEDERLAVTGCRRSPLTSCSAGLLRGAVQVAALFRVRGVALAVGGAALFAAGATAAGVAVASIAVSAASGTISGCVNTTTRVLTVPKSGQSCPTGTTALQWNVQGPAGAPGWGVVDSGPRFHLSHPSALAFDGTHVWVASENNNSVTEINASDGSFVRNLSGGSYNFSSPSALAFDGTHIWVANLGNSLTEINAGDGSFVRNLSGGSYNFDSPFALAYDGSHIWVANVAGASVTEVNVSDGSFVRNLSGGSYNFSLPEALAFDGSHIWVANENSNSVTELNASNGSFVRNLSGGNFDLSQPSGLAFTSVQPVLGTGHIWVANGGNNTVTELNTGGVADGSLVRVVANGSTGNYNFNSPGGLSSDRNHVWVANVLGDSVTEFNTSDGSWVRTPTGPSFGFYQPHAVVVTPFGTWVANAASNSLTGLPAG